MSSSVDRIQEAKAAEAFNRQSAVFDDIYSHNLIIQYKRARVREHVEKFLQPGSNILELNAGTGEDALYFGGKGHHVHATDIAEDMQQVLKQKVYKEGLDQMVSAEICSFNNLESLQKKGPYDLVFSNFAGLNCTHELDKVLLSFPELLKPGGYATLVVMPGFCLWETLLMLHGNFKTAFRRFNGKKGVGAHIEGAYFTCWYYRPSYIRNAVKKQFRVIGTEGLCSIVPPSYFENFPKKHPGLYAWLQKAENKLKDKWPWKTIGDYFIITLQKIS